MSAPYILYRVCYATARRASLRAGRCARSSCSAAAAARPVRMHWGHAIYPCVCMCAFMGVRGGARKTARPIPAPAAASLPLLPATHLLCKERPLRGGWLDHSLLLLICTHLKVRVAAGTKREAVLSGRQEARRVEHSPQLAAALRHHPSVPATCPCTCLHSSNHEEDKHSPIHTMKLPHMSL